MSSLVIHHRRLSIRQIHLAPSAPTLVLLHEGLGSVAMWKDFPDQLAHATGCNALVYSRYGYGESEALAEPRQIDFMHEEALVVLPELLERLDIRQPVLVGHSDGGSIALIHAAHAARLGRSVAGVVAMAPHVMVEDISISSIAAAREAYLHGALRARLLPYHRDVDSAFWGWNRIWLDPAFRAWNIEACLPDIACPVLAIQGEDDEYGTMAQIDRVAALAPDVERLKLRDCRHSPHRDQPTAVILAIQRFIDRIGCLDDTPRQPAGLHGLSGAANLRR